MSEQYPLLSEDFSDDDKCGPRFQRRWPMNLRGRAKYHVKGAAAIMTRWPEHWTSILTYWWIGLGMIALTTFVIYNSLFSIALFQPTNARSTKYGSFKTSIHTTKPSSPPGVFMHVFVNDKEEEDLNKYMPYIEVFANKYKDFTYNLIVVANDTNKETSNLTDESQNEIALNSLWNDDAHYGNLVSSNGNINVKYVTLSNYLNDSPVKKQWKNVSHQFIRFLVRATSVWDKGGIAINPIILTPSSPHASYVEKFVSIIKKFKKNYATPHPEQEYEVPVTKNDKKSPKVNNIRDIIKALERGERSDEYDKEILHTAESRNKLFVNNNEKKPMSVVGQDLVAEKQDKSLNIKTQHPIDEKFIDSKIVTSTKEALEQGNDISNDEDKKDNSSNLLPLFLNYLFHKEQTKSFNVATHSIKKRKSTKTTEVAKSMDSNDVQVRNIWNDIKSTDNYKPMIVSAKSIPLIAAATNSSKPTYQDDDKLFELTVDLKGNIIATKTPCHAFIGNVFINAIHHDEAESLTDFIIKELSIFCKGLLASCIGIDVILV